jgi:molecular chaperone DnaJ
MGPDARDFYEVLGVARSAEAATVKRAFRARARLLHPDVSEDPDAERKFAELAEAYAVLSRPASRLLYDRLGYRGRGAWVASPAAAQALAGLIEFCARSRKRSRDPGQVAVFDLGFYEAARGARRTVHYRSRGPCEACGGSGTAGGTAATCSACSGRGILRRRDDSGDVLLLELVTCECCGGSGRLVTVPCPDCGGCGESEQEREVPFSIPSGAEDGARLPLAGEDGAFVLLRVAPQPRDSAVVRAVAAVGLLVALGFLGLLMFR